MLEICNGIAETLFPVFSKTPTSAARLESIRTYPGIFERVSCKTTYAWLESDTGRGLYVVPALPTKLSETDSGSAEGLMRMRRRELEFEAGMATTRVTESCLVA